MRILIVEDDEGVVELLNIRLNEFFNTEIKSVNNKKALDLTLIDFRPSIILLDLKLKGENGLTILKDLKADQYQKYIPVIVMTGITDERVCETAFNLGANDFITKPIDFNVLFNTIKRILRSDPNLEYYIK